MSYAMVRLWRGSTGDRKTIVAREHTMMKSADTASDTGDFVEEPTVEIPYETLVECAAYWERERLERAERPTRDFRAPCQVAA